MRLVCPESPVSLAQLSWPEGYQTMSLPATHHDMKSGPALAHCACCPLSQQSLCRISNFLQFSCHEQSIAQQCLCLHAEMMLQNWQPGLPPAETLLEMLCLHAEVMLQVWQPSLPIVTHCTGERNCALGGAVLNPGCRGPTFPGQRRHGQTMPDSSTCIGLSYKQTPWQVFCLSF